MSGVFRALLFAVLASGLCAQTSHVEQPCDKVVGLLVTDFRYKVPSSQSARVEIRQCTPEDSATIQLVARPANGGTAALVVNTGDFGVVQAVGRANVFVVETGGATRDQVFVLVYNGGKPRLALRKVTKGTARISTSAAAMDVVIEGIYAGDAPTRTESHHFDLDIEGLRLQMTR